MVEKTTNYLRIVALFRTDYAARFHVRGIAKLLDTSHVTILPHLEQLEQVKILLHQKLGRNKQYLLNKANILTKYYLTATEQIATINFLQNNFVIKKLAEHLSTLDTANPLILFGSYADSSATDESDVDLFSLGMLTKDQTNHIKIFEAIFGKKINAKTATTKNFTNGLRTGDILIKEVVRNHIILHNADPFVTILWRDYVER